MDFKQRVSTLIAHNSISQSESESQNTPYKHKIILVIVTNIFYLSCTWDWWHITGWIAVQHFHWYFLMWYLVSFSDQTSSSYKNNILQSKCSDFFVYTMNAGWEESCHTVLKEVQSTTTYLLVSMIGGVWGLVCVCVRVLFSDRLPSSLYCVMWIRHHLVQWILGTFCSYVTIACSFLCHGGVTAGGTSHRWSPELYFVFIAN